MTYVSEHDIFATFDRCVGDRRGVWVDINSVQDDDDVKNMMYSLTLYIIESIKHINGSRTYRGTRTANSPPSAVNS